MIRFEQVTRDFGSHRAVDALSLTVAEGETLMLLGTSGCGKTTTLRMVNRLLETSAGNIFIQDRNIRDQAPETLRRGIGYVLQHNSLFPHYTVAENIAVVPRLLGWKEDRIRDRTEELILQLKLPIGVGSRYPAQLSGGQQQRVNVARALAADPEILLMDEPFGALDPVTRASIRKDFRQLEALQRKTILMVTHDVAEAFELGDRICLMYEGKALQTGTPSSLLFRPEHHLVRSFLSESYPYLSLITIRLADILHLLPQEAAGRLTAPHLQQLSISALMDPVSGIPEEGDASLKASILTAFYQFQQTQD